MLSRIQYFPANATDVSPRESGEVTRVFLTGTPSGNNQRIDKPKPIFGRPSVERETSWSVVKRAIPRGWSRPTNIAQVVSVFDTHPAIFKMRADTKKVLRRCLSAMVASGDPKTRTTKATKASLAKALNIHERSVSRYWRKLESLNLISLVAPGRSKSEKWAPSHQLSKKGPSKNLAAVYVFCVPGEALQRRWEQNAKAAADSHGWGRPVTPTIFDGSLRTKKFNPRTGAQKSSEESKSQECSQESAINAGWDKHQVPSSRKEMLAAAGKLRELSPAFFGRMSDKDIRSQVRQFFASHWSPADVERALAVQPDGSPWPHDTPTDAWALQRLRPWVKYRLSAWKDAQGAPTASFWMLKKERQRLDRLKKRATRAGDVLKSVVRWAEVELSRDLRDYKQADGYRDARKYLDQLFASNSKGNWKKHRSMRIPVVTTHTV